MKVKLDREEIQAIIIILQGILDGDLSYLDDFEAFVTRVAASELMAKLWKQQAKMKEQNNITLSPIEMIVLSRQLPHIAIDAENPWLESLLSRLIMQISPKCLNT